MKKYKITYMGIGFYIYAYNLQQACCFARYEYYKINCPSST